MSINTLNNYDELLFSDKLKNTKLRNMCNTSINTYRDQDVSEYPNMKKNMKKYRVRLFELLKTLMQSNEKRYSNNDENEIITVKFIEFTQYVFEHFENLEKMKDVNTQFKLLSTIDKVLLMNNSS